ncbi:hypothetical protein [Actinomadura parmotrematis]|uniref:Lipoprotein LpqB beta-propeller domain-containing protein n=1 Tax=Actinomadura parmotrematis TaxID=2864039 RepID=A0ABS7G3G6_9ACTN|nr:hypothetical protein [Actinomadura parmotrematis]MBW8487264.1 hypothetical protein [Actinomadura parmotrematis]
MDGGSTEGPARGRAPLFRLRGLLPLGAAAGACLCLSGALDLVHHHERIVHRDHRAKVAAEKVAAAKAPAGKVRGESRYVVGVRRTGTALVVRDIGTGKDVGVPVAAPPGQRFQRIASGGDGSYVVAAASAGKVAFQRLRLDGKGRPTSLAPIPGVAISAAARPGADMAVNRGDGRIAYAVPASGGARLAVLDPKAGGTKAWTARGAGRITSLSWAGPTLSFVWTPGAGKAAQVRTLDTLGAAAGSLKASKVVLRLPEGGPAVLSPDGATVFAGVPAASAATVRAYSVSTGKPTKDVWSRPLEGGLTRLDAGRANGHLLVSAADGRLYVPGAPAAVPAADLSDAAW